MNHILRAAMVSLLLVMLPTAMADMQIIQGPSAMASSNGALALGGKLLVTDPTGDAPDGGYYALLGLNALAIVPNGAEGYAYVNLVNQGDSFSKSIDLTPFDAHGDKVRFDMSYTGSVSANVEKSVPRGTAISYAGIGSGVADFAVPVPVSFTDCFDAQAGGAGMLALLSLPNNAVGNAGASGSAMFNIEKLGDPQMVGGALVSDEVLRTYGNVIGEAVIAGDGHLIDGTPAAQNNVFGLATLGTATVATDNAGILGTEGAALSASGMGTVTAASTGLFGLDSLIAANVAGEAVGGAWDGSTPMGTNQIKGGTDNVRTVTSGSVNSVAETYLNGDFAGSLSLLGNLAFHSNSPITLPAAMKDAPYVAALETQTGIDYNEIVGLLGEGDLKANEIMQTSDILKSEDQDAKNSMLMLSNLNQFKPEIVFKDDITDPKDPIVAANIAVTGAIATRDQMGTWNSPVLTAEAFINDADSNAVAKMGDRSVVASLDEFTMGSGAHLRSHPDTVGSLGFAVQGAGQTWGTTIGSPEGHANVGIYGALTVGPTADGDRWDDAGTLMKFEEGLMESSKGTTPNSAYFRTTNGPLDEITWIEGSDFNPRLYGQNYNSVFEDNIAGSLVQVTGKSDNLVYLENQVIFPGRNTLWLSATVHGGIQ